MKIGAVSRALLKSPTVVLMSQPGLAFDPKPLTARNQQANVVDI